GHAHAHAGRGGVAAVEDGLEVLDAGPPVADADEEGGRGLPVEEELDLAAAGVLEGVAGDLGDGGGDAGLGLGRGAEQARQLAGALPGQHHVVLQADLLGQERLAHGRAPLGARATSTVTSSRPLWKSRYSTPATRAGSRPASPGYAPRS